MAPHPDPTLRFTGVAKRCQHLIACLNKDTAHLLREKKSAMFAQQQEVTVSLLQSTFHNLVYFNNQCCVVHSFLMLSAWGTQASTPSNVTAVGRKVEKFKWWYSCTQQGPGTPCNHKQLGNIGGVSAEQGDSWQTGSVCVCTPVCVSVCVCAQKPRIWPLDNLTYPSSDTSSVESLRTCCCPQFQNSFLMHHFPWRCQWNILLNCKKHLGQGENRAGITQTGGQ